MSAFTPTRSETKQDKTDYLTARLAEVSCLDCLATARVKKNSDHHTSVQWDSAGVQQCQEFHKMATAPGGRDLHDSCSKMMASIETAVSDGKLEVGAIDGY